jgi:hypothetical protein
MTSAINYSLINKDFPIAGQDNDSVGFRNNFAATQTALHTAHDEITALQTNSVLVANLATNAPVVNNMLGSAIFNATFAQFNGIFYDAGTVSGLAVNVDLNNGPIQKFTITQGTSGSPTVLTFINWPPAGTWATVRLMLVTSAVSPCNYNVVFQTANSGTIKTATGFTSPLVVPTSGKYEMVEAWTVDHGQNVFVKSIGEY